MVWRAVRSRCGRVGRSRCQPALSRLTDDHRRTYGYGYGACSPTVRRWWRYARDVRQRERVYYYARRKRNAKRPETREPLRFCSTGSPARSDPWTVPWSWPGSPAAESQPIPDHRSCLAYSAKRVVSAPLGCTHAINSARGWGDASRRMQCKRERRRCDGTATAPREATHPHAPIASAPPREGTRNLAT
jgi:hypothetical protein